MSFNPNELVVLATLGGAIVGTLPGIISTFVNKKSDEKKQFNEMVVKAATESWKTHVEHASGGILPLEHYIIHTSKMCDLALNGKINTKNAKQKLSEIDSLMTILAEHASKTPKK